MDIYTSKKSSFFPEIDQIYPGTGRLHDKRHDPFTIYTGQVTKSASTHILLYTKHKQTYLLLDTIMTVMI